MLDTPAAPKVRPPEIVLREWHAENERQYVFVVAKAEKVDSYARRLLSGHERRQEAHRLQKPQAPTGMFASVKRGAYDVAAKAWEQTRARSAIGSRGLVNRSIGLPATCGGLRLGRQPVTR